MGSSILELTINEAFMFSIWFLFGIILNIFFCSFRDNLIAFIHVWTLAISESIRKEQRLDGLISMSRVVSSANELILALRQFYSSQQYT